MAWPFPPFPLILAQQTPAAEGKTAAAGSGGEVKAAPAGAKNAPVAEAKAGTKVAPAAQPAPDTALSPLILLGPPVFLVWLLWIRPQGQQEKKKRQMVSAMKKNDKVLTVSGMYGTVISVDPAADKVVVRVDDDKGIKITFSKAGIARVIEPSGEKAPESSS